MVVESLLLPLTPQGFHLLVALVERDLHGYAIMQGVAARTHGKLRLSPGTLYGSIKRLLEQGLIIELENDSRRRYYRLTPFGRKVAKPEAARLIEDAIFAKSPAFRLMGGFDHGDCSRLPKWCCSGAPAVAAVIRTRLRRVCGISESRLAKNAPTDAVCSASFIYALLDSRVCCYWGGGAIARS